MGCADALVVSHTGSQCRGGRVGCAYALCAGPAANEALGGPHRGTRRPQSLVAAGSLIAWNLRHEERNAMSREATQVFGQQTQPITRPMDRGREWAKQAAIVVAASLFVALCARVTVPLPFTPVPLTLQNFGVLAVGLLLGSRRGF